MPFAYAIDFLALLGTLVGGFWLLGTGLRRNASGLRWTGILLVIGVVAVVGLEIDSEKSMEWNPSVPSDTELIGHWAQGNETLELTANHMFHYQAPGLSSTGDWSRDDWNLHLQNPNSQLLMRIVQYRKHYRIMTHPPGDTDNWDGNPGLTKVNK